MASAQQERVSFASLARRLSRELDGAAALWLLTLLVTETRRRVSSVALLAAAWICMSVQPPLPDPEATIVLWMSGQIATLILGFWVLLRKQPPIEAAEARVR